MFHLPISREVGPVRGHSRVEERRPEMGLEWYIEQIFKELPFGVAIAIAVFLGILLIIWLLLPALGFVYSVEYGQDQGRNPKPRRSGGKEGMG